MPSHIFTRVGSWAESIATNERPAVAARQDKDFDEQLHAMDYMVYASLQLARDADAHRMVDEAAAVTGFTTLRFAGPYAQAAMPARYAIERSDWKQAMTLESRPSQFLFTTALTHFPRGLGAARGGDAVAAEKKVEALARLRDALKTAKSDYWATEVEVSRLGGDAWTAHALGKHDEALGLMRSAADIEDKNEKHIVTPARIAPARELRGEMLMEHKRPAEALKEFEASRVREPERVKARRYFARLVELAGQGATRPELAQARAFLAANP